MTPLRRTLLILAFAALPLLSQTPAPDAVTVAVTITTAGKVKTYSTDLPAPAVRALAQFVAETKAEGTNGGPETLKFATVADLLFRTLSDRLIAVLVPRYPDTPTKAAMVAAEVAAKAASDATAAAASFAVTVK